jgi:hypothetical protein
MTHAHTDPRQFRLVYLDTWTISTLARALRTDIKRFNEFQGIWKKTRSMLALSRTHLFELRRHKDSEVRAARYDLIEALLPARFDMLLNLEQPALNALTDREISAEILRHLGRGAIVEKLGRYRFGFPLEIESKAHVTTIREQMESDDIGGVLNLLHSALDIASSADARAPRTPYVRTRLADVSDSRPTDDQIDQAKQLIDSSLQDHPLLAEIHSLVTPEQFVTGLSEATTLLHSILIRAQAVGFQQAIREGDGHRQSRRNEFFDVHLQNQSFTNRVRSVATAFTSVTDQVAIDLVTQGVKRTNCPGLWLRDATEVELRKAKHHAKPNDWFDLDHLTHLPYVDLQFADREIATATRQVLKRRDQLPEVLLNTQPPISTSASLEAVGHEILRFAETGR